MTTALGDPSPDTSDATATQRGHELSAFVIFATPRSGSYLLCEDLTATGVAGRPTEYLSGNWRALALRHGLNPLVDTAQYIDLLMAHECTPNGVFGIKLMWQHFLDLSEQLRSELPELGSGGTLVDFLRRRCGPVRLIWIRRRDKVGQAISYWKALQTGEWSRYGTEPTSTRPNPCYDYAAIRELGRRLVEEERGTADYLSASQLPVLPVWYEDLDAERRATTEVVVRYLGCNLPPLPNPPVHGLVRQADTLTEDWRSRFVRDFHRENGPPSC